jgi:hypothetical protein
MARLMVLPALLLLSACSDEAQQAPIVGGDVDQHGCKASAGYSWCQETGKCERPWELAKANGFSNTAEGYDAFCNSGP